MLVHWSWNVENSLIKNFGIQYEWILELLRQYWRADSSLCIECGPDSQLSIKGMTHAMPKSPSGWCVADNADILRITSEIVYLHFHCTLVVRPEAGGWSVTWLCLVTWPWKIYDTVNGILAPVTSQITNIYATCHPGKAVRACPRSLQPQSINQQSLFIVMVKSKMKAREMVLLLLWMVVTCAGEGQ